MLHGNMKAFSLIKVCGSPASIHLSYCFLFFQPVCCSGCLLVSAPLSCVCICHSLFMCGHFKFLFLSLYRRSLMPQTQNVVCTVCMLFFSVSACKYMIMWGHKPWQYAVTITADCLHINTYIQIQLHFERARLIGYLDAKHIRVHTHAHTEWLKLIKCLHIKSTQLSHFKEEQRPEAHNTTLNSLSQFTHSCTCTQMSDESL